MTLVFVLSGLGASSAWATPESDPVTSTAERVTVDPASEDPPPTTLDDFFPEDSNLSDCLGLVEKPGCGSKSRGGWRQTLVFAVVLAGLSVIFWRISVGVRRNRQAPSN